MSTAVTNPVSGAHARRVSGTAAQGQATTEQGVRKPRRTTIKELRAAKSWPEGLAYHHKRVAQGSRRLATVLPLLFIAALGVVAAAAARGATVLAVVASLHLPLAFLGLLALARVRAERRFLRENGYAVAGGPDGCGDAGDDEAAGQQPQQEGGGSAWMSYLPSDVAGSSRGPQRRTSALALVGGAATRRASALAAVPLRDARSATARLRVALDAAATKT